ncbi:MAG: hypothetical protein LBM12_02735 [Candidatus Nomurabacteria bacterium]|jgi:hypothetical protein|nr:hypothetical protein [Candidatus Nomurabacteria bacterium]
MNFFRVQDAAKPLFTDNLLAPERRDLMGKILLIGGSSAGFAGVNYAYTKAKELGAGEVKVLFPKTLEKLLPKNPDFIFSGDPKSLGFTKAAENDLQELAAWADGILFVGDFGKNAETAQVFSNFLEQGYSQDNKGDSASGITFSKKSLLITRDAIDLLLPALPLENPNAKLFLTFTQLQKLLKSVFYPKIITSTMPLPQLAEVLHKLTLTYQCGIATFANDNFLVAQNGEVISTSLPTTKYNPLTLWGGEPAVKALLLSIWNPTPKIAALAESVL